MPQVGLRDGSRMVLIGMLAVCAGSRRHDRQSSRHPRALMRSDTNAVIVGACYGLCCLAASRRQAEKEAIYAADDGSMPPLHLLQRSERATKIAAYPGGALHATEHLGPGADFRQMKVALALLCPSGVCTGCMLQMGAPTGK